MRGSINLRTDLKCDVCGGVNGLGVMFDHSCIYVETEGRMVVCTVCLRELLSAAESSEEDPRLQARLYQMLGTKQERRFAAGDKVRFSDDYLAKYPGFARQFTGIGVVTASPMTDAGELRLVFENKRVGWFYQVDLVRA